MATVSLQSRAAPLGENPFQLDSAAPRVKLADYFKLEQRFKILEKSEPRAARELLDAGAGRRERSPRILRISRHEKIQHHTKPMNLTTRYLGFKLRTPLVPSASPLSEKIDNIKRMEDAGAAAIVFHSLFEEQIRRDHHDLDFYLEQGTESFCGIADVIFLFVPSSRLGRKRISSTLPRRKRRFIYQSSVASTAAPLAAG